MNQLRNGKFQIVSFLKDLPATEHDPQSFAVDLTLFTVIFNRFFLKLKSNSNDQSIIDCKSISGENHSVDRDGDIPREANGINISIGAIVAIISSFSSHYKENWWRFLYNQRHAAREQFDNGPTEDGIQANRTSSGHHGSGPSANCTNTNQCACSPHITRRFNQIANDTRNGQWQPNESGMEQIVSIASTSAILSLDKYDVFTSWIRYFHFCADVWSNRIGISNRPHVHSPKLTHKGKFQKKRLWNECHCKSVCFTTCSWSVTQEENENCFTLYSSQFISTENLYMRMI